MSVTDEHRHKHGSVLSVEDEINQISMGRPHIVLLGAGASRQAFPRGDRNGYFLPVMTEFDRLPRLDALCRSAGIVLSGKNFEDVYSSIAEDPQKRELREEIEREVFAYFSRLSLPDTPTIYDHLIVSLRSKDFIATFNWDPFLIQALRRHPYLPEKPKLLFLHGNVLHGYCAKDDVHGMAGNSCSRCGISLASDRLLFPIAQKDYETDPSIRASWNAMKRVMKQAFMFTVFGYGAPDSDRSAVDLLKNSWGSPHEKSIEQTEIIDIRSEEELEQRWRPFIHSHHYETHEDFYDSWISKHPRRTGEAFWNQYMDALFIPDNPLPSTGSLNDLKQWLTPLLDAEQQAQSKLTKLNNETN